MHTYKTRPSEQSDLPFLMDVLYLSLFIPEGQDPPDRSIIHTPELIKYVEGWGRTGDYARIALNDLGEPVGAVMFRLYTESHHGYGYVDPATPELGMAIVPAYRGQGIGNRLLEEAIQEAARQGYQKLSLSVDPNNPAVRLYRRHGFKEVGWAGTSITMVLVLTCR